MYFFHNNILQANMQISGKMSDKEKQKRFFRRTVAIEDTKDVFLM